MVVGLAEPAPSSSPDSDFAAEAAACAAGPQEPDALFWPRLPSGIREFELKELGEHEDLELCLAEGPSYQPCDEDISSPEPLEDEPVSVAEGSCRELEETTTPPALDLIALLTMIAFGTGALFEGVGAMITFWEAIMVWLGSASPKHSYIPSILRWLVLVAGPASFLAWVYVSRGSRSEGRTAVRTLVLPFAMNARGLAIMESFVRLPDTELALPSRKVAMLYYGGLSLIAMHVFGAIVVLAASPPVVPLGLWLALLLAVANVAVLLLAMKFIKLAHHVYDLGVARAGLASASAELTSPDAEQGVEVAGAPASDSDASSSREAEPSGAFRSAPLSATKTETTRSDLAGPEQEQIIRATDVELETAGRSLEADTLPSSDAVPSVLPLSEVPASQLEQPSSPALQPPLPPEGTTGEDPAATHASAAEKVTTQDQAMVSQAAGVLWVVAVVSIAIGVLSLVFPSRIGELFGLGWFSLVAGFVFGVFAWMTEKKRSLLALTVALLAFVADTVTLFYTYVQILEQPPIFAVVIRFLFIIILARGLGALVRLRRGEAEP